MEIELYRRCPACGGVVRFVWNSWGDWRCCFRADDDCAISCVTLECSKCGVCFGGEIGCAPDDEERIMKMCALWWNAGCPKIEPDIDGLRTYNTSRMIAHCPNCGGGGRLFVDHFGVFRDLEIENEIRGYSVVDWCLGDVSSDALWVKNNKPSCWKIGCVDCGMETAGVYAFGEIKDSPWIADALECCWKGRGKTNGGGLLK